MLEQPTDDGISLEEPSPKLDAMMDAGQDPYEHEVAEHHPWLDFDPAQAARARPKYEVTPHRILEAMLFVGSPDGEALDAKRVASLMRGVRADEIEEFVQDLNNEYEKDAAPYRIVSGAGGYRMVLREEFSAVRNRFYGEIKEAALPQPAVDVLSLVAYKQPLTKEEVNKLRGKPSGSLLSQLVRRQLLCVERTDEKPRRTLYRTTERFLKLFGIDSLDDLPSVQ
jgi:segregation and condensation protein B